VQEHVHTGFVAFVVYGVMIVIFLNLWKIAAAYATSSDNPTIAGLGASAGALINFGGGKA
jgi:hypothetical protein